MPNKDEVIKNFQKNYKEGFKPNSFQPDNSYEFATTIVLVNRNGTKIFGNDFYCNLASTSKPFIMIFAEKLILEQKINNLFEVNKDFVSEFIWRRGGKRIWNNKNFLEIKEYIIKNSKVDPKKIPAKLFARKSNFVNWENFDRNEFKLPFEEICHAVLGRSSNEGLVIIKKTLENFFGNSKLLQQAFEEAGICPTLELSESVEYLWVQDGANCALISQAVNSFHKIVQENIENGSIVLANMKNNPVYFDIGIASDLIARKIIPQKYNIFEKTGLSVPITYGKKLMDQNFPPHIVIETIFTIQDKKTNELTSLGIFKILAVALPKDLDKNGIPNTKTKNYHEYIQLSKLKHIRKFKKDVLRLLKSQGIIVNIPGKLFLKNTARNILKRVYYTLVLRTLS